MKRTVFAAAEVQPNGAIVRSTQDDDIDRARIHAYGDACAQYGAAVAEARSRILVLERDRR